MKKKGNKYTRIHALVYKINQIWMARLHPAIPGKLTRFLLSAEFEI